MKTNRTWLWLGGALVVAAGILALGVPLGTVLTIAAVLACPAAMFLGMGMMGRMQGGQAVEPSGPPAVPGAAAAGTSPMGPESAGGHETEDPIAILKRRLARGEVSLEEYERLAMAISGPHPALRRD